MKRTIIKDQGYALVSVMIFLIILILIIISLIQIIHYEYRMILKDTHQMQADYLVESGAALFLNNLEQYYAFISADILEPYCVVYPFESDSIRVTAIPWGGFIRINVDSWYKSARTHKQALIGQKMTSQMNNAINLGNLDNSLVLTGETEITGNVVVGPRGVKSGNLKGNRFKGQRLIKGDIITTNRSQMSMFNPYISFEATKKRLEYLILNEMSIGEELLNKNKTSYLYINKSIELNDFSILDSTRACTLITTGSITIDSNIMIPRQSIFIAGDSIFIGKCKTNQSLFYGKKLVQISNNFTGNAQFISDFQIDVKEGAILEWPSVLYVSREKSGLLPDQVIVIGNGASVHGAVILYSIDQDENNSTNSTRIVINKSASIYGLVYTNQSVELAGEIFGHVSLGSFYLYNSPTLYINWLLDAKIDNIKLDKDFPIPVSFGEEQDFCILNWQTNRR